MGACHLASRRYPPSDSIYRPICGRRMAGPTFSYGRLTAGRMEVPILINPSFRLRRPRPPPPPPLLPFCPRHPTHSADYNTNILYRIISHQLALILSLITPTTDYVLHLEHEPLRCANGSTNIPETDLVCPLKAKGLQFISPYLMSPPVCRIL